MLMKRHVAALFLLSIILLSAAPMLVFADEDNEENEDATEPEPKKYFFTMRAQKLLISANRTANRIEIYIERIYSNESLIGNLTEAGLLDDLEGNVTLFEDAKELLKEASEEIESNNYEDAIDKIIEAMKIFREVFVALHKIIEDYVAPVRNQMIAQGLIVAMQRALERIERIRTLAPEDNENITELLEETEQLLDIEAAKKMLAEGNVTAVAHNLAEANKLIGQAYQLLKKEAANRVWARVNTYIKGMMKAYQRIMIKIAIAKKIGINVSAILEDLGYHNETEFKEALLNMTMTVRSKAKELRNVLFELHKISQAFWRMNSALVKHVYQHRWRSQEAGGEQSAGQNQSYGQNQTRNKSGSSAGFGKGGNSSGWHGRP
ncbi:hypothetical protein CW705_05475 [Candidatus Bathyarchaeota archaeon]|nr:MAG: hypothetical protein CW705_05475 [Candidatus Bathyarchaeota archaeon]